MIGKTIFHNKILEKLGDSAQSNLVLVENWFEEFKDKK